MREEITNACKASETNMSLEDERGGYTINEIEIEIETEIETDDS
jgi:hypothetical protein